MRVAIARGDRPRASTSSRAKASIERRVSGLSELGLVTTQGPHWTVSGTHLVHISYTSPTSSAHHLRERRAVSIPHSSRVRSANLFGSPVSVAALSWADGAVLSQTDSPKCQLQNARPRWQSCLRQLLQMLRVQGCFAAIVRSMDVPQIGASTCGSQKGAVRFCRRGQMSVRLWLSPRPRARRAPE